MPLKAGMTDLRHDPTLVASEQRFASLYAHHSAELLLLMKSLLHRSHTLCVVSL